MSYDFGILSGWLLISSIFSFMIAVYSWKHRFLANSLYLSLLTFATGEWALAGVFEAAATDVSLKTFWSQVSYLGIVLTPVFYLLFALSYSHRENLINRRNILLISIIPGLTFLAAISNQAHHLIWLDVSISDFNNIGLYDHGVWFFVSMAYSYILIIYGLFNIYKGRKQLSSSYSAQLKVITLGALIPLLGNFLYVFDLAPIQGLDWTPIAFGFSGVLFAIGIFRYSMLSIVPLARDFLVETMSDGLLILDLQDQVVDINPAMGNIIGLPDSKTIGRSVASVLSDLPELLALILENDEFETTLEVKTQDQVLRYHNIQVTWITLTGGVLGGRMVLCKDVTALEKAKIALQESK